MRLVKEFDLDGVGWLSLLEISFPGILKAVQWTGILLTSLAP